MQEQSRRTGFSGPKLIRLLARLKNADIPESRQSPSDRLSLWLGWTDAIALSAALSSTPPAVSGSLFTPGDTEERECVRVRTGLESTITGSNAPAPSRQRGQLRARVQDDAGAPEAIEYATYRRRYAYLQQTMETNIGHLRRRVRSTLTAMTPELIRLAAVDAVMEQALGAHERSLLASVPTLLEGHFKRLQLAEQEALADAQASEETSTVTPGAWLEVFRKDMESVLLAELDIRFQPIEGLLAATRAC